MPDEDTDPPDTPATAPHAVPDSTWRTYVLEPVRAAGQLAAGAIRRRVMKSRDDDYEDPQGNGWQLFSAIAERMVRAVGDAQLVLVPLPTRPHLRGELRDTYRQRFRELEGHLRSDKGGPRFLDVLEPMVAIGEQSGGKLAFDFDGHYTPTGHLALAGAVTEQLRLSLGDTLGPDVPGTPPPHSRVVETGGPSVVARWTLFDSEVRVENGQSPDPAQWRSEVQLTADLGVTGTLPWSAIAAELDRHSTYGSAVVKTRLESPVDAATLADHDAPFEEWFELAAAWVRWQGAAETDLRHIFRITTQVEHVVVPQAGIWEEARRRAKEWRPNDAESDWLGRRLRSIHAKSKRAPLLMQLAVAWERATRRARYATLLLPAPPRR